MLRAVLGKRCGLWALAAGALVAATSLPAHAQQPQEAPAAAAEPASGQKSAGETGDLKGETGGPAGETGTTQGPSTAPPGPLATPPARPEPLLRTTSDGEADDGAGMRDPAYFLSGVITLSIAGAFAVGGMVALATDDTEPPPLPAPGESPASVNQPQTAIGLVGFAVGNAALGVPLLLLGAASERPNNPEAVAAGTALATAGVAVAGVGAVFGVAQASYVNEPQADGAYDTDAGPIALPLTLGIAGAAAAVAGVIVWAGGAGEADDEAQQDSAGSASPLAGLSAQLIAGPGSLNLHGHF